MLSLAGTPRIFLCRDPIDMRKGFDGLGQVIESYFDEVLSTGAYFVFLNRNRDKMKVLYWDGDGMAIWYKRLERGTFARLRHEENTIDRRQFLMLLEGVEPYKLRIRYKAA